MKCTFEPSWKKMAYWIQGFKKKANTEMVKIWKSITVLYNISSLKVF